jgi:ubiquinone/menaquinone biosynthesis C-methylase UbiE
LNFSYLNKILKAKGILTIIDFVTSIFINKILRRFYRLDSSDYGLPETFFHSRDIDRWSRYTYVINEIQKTKMQHFSILEVGSGGKGISIFLNSLRMNCSIFLLDIRRNVFKNLKVGNPIIADGCNLPFKDKAFDIVVSVDTIEHVPRSGRHNLYNELKRVCKKRIIITCPMQSSDGTFQGKKYDNAFQFLYEKYYGVKEPNTEQHITAGHPTLEEIKSALPNSTIRGYKNCDVWLKYMLFSCKPFIGYFTGLLYYMFWKRNDNKPPYWGAIIVSNCMQRKSLTFNNLIKQ